MCTASENFSNSSVKIFGKDDIKWKKNKNTCASDWQTAQDHHREQQLHRAQSFIYPVTFPLTETATGTKNKPYQLTGGEA